jgi:hypothetical protein
VLLTLGLATPVLAQNIAPNHLTTVKDVAANFNIGTDEGLTAFMDASVCALNARDSRWGHLRKTGNSTKIHDHAHDGALYLSDTPGQSQFVDYVGSAGSSNASIGWGFDEPRYSRSDWLPPHNCGTVQPPVVTPPVPTPAVDLSAITASLARIESTLSALATTQAATQAHVSEVDNQLGGVASRIEVLLTSSDRIIRQLLSPPDYNGRFVGLLRPTVKPVAP